MSVLLLDTQAVLWFFRDDPSLSNIAKQAIEDPNNKKLVSLATPWELAIKINLGKLNIGEPVESYFEREMARSYFEFLPIQLRHAATIETLPLHHRDPFDRIIIAQAIVEKIPIVTADSWFTNYPIQVIW